MLLTFLAILHVLIAVVLVLFVLIQDPKGGAAGMFGGGGGGQNTLFGATGASNFLTKVTKWMAISFAVTSIALTYITSHKGGSVMDEYIPPAPTSEGAGGGMDTEPPMAENGEAAEKQAPENPQETPKSDSQETTTE